MKFLPVLLAIPLLAQKGVNFYSLEKERAMGQQYAAEIRRQTKPLDNPVVAAYAKQISGRLAAGVVDSQVAYEFEVISDGDHREPFGLPGGFVFIPARAFLAAQDEAEFAGMLAHAVGHSALRHGTRDASRAQIVNMASIPLVYMGGWQSAHSEAGRAPVLVPMSLLEFHRGYELEADRFGVELAARSGYDPSAYLRYVERTHVSDTKYSPLPARELRLEKLRESIASLTPAAYTAAGEEFRSAQEAVRSIVERPSQRRVPTLRR